MPTKFPPYQSQLLRMWAEQPARRPPVWRFSLEDVGTGQRSGFADLDALICHLLELMEEQPDQRQAERELDQQLICKPLSMTKSEQRISRAKGNNR